MPEVNFQPDVYLSPSTQEWNKYKNMTTEEETQMNLVCDQLIPLLDSRGITYHRNQRTLTYAEAIAESDAMKAKLHLAIHTDAGGGQGTTAFCYSPTNATAKGTIFANNIYKYVAALSPGKDRGVKTGVGLLAEVYRTKAPACLIEIEFHDYAQGADWITKNIRAEAIALFQGILDTKGMEQRPIDSPFVAPVPAPSIPLRVFAEGDRVVLNGRGCTSADGKGALLVRSTRPARIIKIAPLFNKYPYALNYTNGTWVDAWFERGAIS